MFTGTCPHAFITGVENKGTQPQLTGCKDKTKQNHRIPKGKTKMGSGEVIK
jgi:hypothetical protein